MGTRRTRPDIPGQREPPPAWGTPERPVALDQWFGPRFGGAALQRELLLQTEDTLRVLRRDYLHLCRMLHAIARTRGYPGVEPAALNRIEETVAQGIRNLREATALRRAELARRFDQRPDATTAVAHPRAARFQAPVASPHAMQFLDALAAADECLALSGAAWLQGLVSPQDHHGLRRQVRRGLAAVKTQVEQARNQCFGLRGASRKKPAAARTAAGPEAAAMPPRSAAPAPPPAAPSSRPP